MENREFALTIELIEGEPKKESVVHMTHQEFDRLCIRGATAERKVKTLEAQLAEANARLSEARDEYARAIFDRDEALWRVEIAEGERDVANARAEAAEQRFGEACKKVAVGDLLFRTTMKEIHGVAESALRREQVCDALTAVNRLAARLIDEVSRAEQAESRAADLAKVVQDIHEIAANYADNYAREADAMPRIFDIAHMALNPSARQSALRQSEGGGE